ncbi:PREDICTED: synaptonemal complex protein 2-like [Charadrius vociferus]|uniref:synaptonemal complex protein 2-like n=1 Tax=Charadrius vociferus TaxID=50402 RepID=UPI000521BA3F|nr:PREDICTED: synaptonemal complex protein 2-like [Charadrius vociferus]
MAQEGKNEDRNKEMNVNVVAIAEDYLESLLTDAFKGKGYQKISELLQEREIEPLQKYSKSLFSQLDKALRKELDKNEFENVSLLLKCIQLYFKSDLQEGTSLFIEQGLVEKMRKKELVNLFLPELGHLVTEASISCNLRQEERPCKNYAGDYDLQVALSEALCRLMTKKWRDDLVHHWFEDNYLAEAFKEIKDREFETVKKPSDEKLEEFWIDFNTGSQSVTFYVDSNEGALWDSVRLSKEAVSSYSLKEEDGENIVKIYMKIPATLNKTEATKIKISFSAEFEILSVLRKVLGDEKMMINVAEEESIHAGKQARQNEAVVPESTNPEGRKDPSNMDTVSDNLASQHSQQITGTVPKMVNSGVTMITVSQQTDAEDANRGSAKADKCLIVAPEGEAVVSLPPSAKKSKSPSPGMKAKPSEKPLEEEPMEESTPKKAVTWQKRNRRRSLAKKRTEGRKDLYDFENSDSASHEKVAEAKGKVLGQKVSSQNQRSYETGNKTEESNKLERRLKYHDTSGTLSREEESLKRKDSGILSGTVIKKPKFSSWETSHLSSDTSYVQRQFFDSVEKEAEIQTGQEMDDSVDDAFFSKMLHEDFSDSGVIAAFESFTGQLKKLFWSRYKRMETSAQNTLRTSEKNVSTPLNQIHECRLSKLETFQKIVVEELASLEKETQILASMEKDAVDFWNGQLLKLNSFCNQQKQRIQSVDSALGETAKSFADTVQNTTYEHPMKAAVENNVFIVPSD